MTTDRVADDVTEVWVLTQENIEFKDHRVVAVTTSVEAAQLAATADLDPDWPALEWVQQPDESWTTYLSFDLRYTAELFEVRDPRAGRHVEGCRCLVRDGAVLNVDLRCEIP